MINLLPFDAKKKLARERFGRFLFAAGLVLFSLSTVLAGLLGLTLLSLKLQKSEFARELGAAQKSPALLRVEEVEASINRLNERLRIFSRSLKRENAVTHILAEIISLKTPSVSISEIGFKGPAEFRMSGKAITRNGLLEFIGRIEKSDFVEKVSSPITNLLKDRDIDFELLFTVHPDSLIKKFSFAP